MERRRLVSDQIRQIENVRAFTTVWSSWRAANRRLRPNRPARNPVGGVMIAAAMAQSLVTLEFDEA